MLKWLWIFFLSFPSWGLELFTWKPHANRPPIVIGVRDGETPKQAAERFLTALNNGPRYKNLHTLFARSPMPKMDLINFAPLSHVDFGRRVLLVANRPEDLSNNDWRIPTFSKPFAEEDMPSYIVPIAADAALDDADSRELIRELNEKFPRFIGLGGDDVSGKHFGDSDQGSVNINEDRDAFEIALFTQKYKTIRSPNPGPHRIWGTCRALQLIARIMGQKIHPHIDGHGGIGEGALHFRATQIEPTHKIRVLKTRHSLLRSMVGTDEFVGNSYHHKFSEQMLGGPLELAALSPDGIPEAYESTDGRIFLLQFHAELMIARSKGEVQQMGRRIFKGVARFLLYGPSTCEGDLATSI